MSSDLWEARMQLTLAWQNLRDLADEFDAEGDHVRAERERNIAAGFAAAVVMIERIGTRGRRTWLDALKKFLSGGDE